MQLLHDSEKVYIITLMEIHLYVRNFHQNRHDFLEHTRTCEELIYSLGIFKNIIRVKSFVIRFVKTLSIYWKYSYVLDFPHQIILFVVDISYL